MKNTVLSHTVQPHELTADKSNDDDMDAFFAQFDNPDDKAGYSNPKSSDNDDIEEFLKQFDSIGTTNPDEDDWRS